MTAKFQLHPHEVWSKDIITTGEFFGGGDLSPVLPSNVWNDSRFVWSRYSPRGQDDFAVGHIIFRPQDGDISENFFVADKVHHSRNVEACNMGEFIFGSQQVDVPRLEDALANNSWGRVFYLNNDNEFRDEQTRGACDWGLFLSAKGLGVWKWAKWNGVTWGKTSPEGIFRWSVPELTSAHFLATSSSSTLRTYIVSLLADSLSEMAYTKRWLQVPQRDEDTGEISLERLEELSLWKRGSMAEAQQVLRWLLIEEVGRRQEEAMLAIWQFKPTEQQHDSVWILKNPDSQLINSKYLQNAFDALRDYFQVHLNIDSPYLCTDYWSIIPSLRVEVEQPTAHERLEARLRLREWGNERGLSFD